MQVEVSARNGNNSRSDWQLGLAYDKSCISLQWINMTVCQTVMLIGISSGHRRKVVGKCDVIIGDIRAIRDHVGV